MVQRDSDARFRGLIEHAEDLIAVLSADGSYLYASPSFERVRGYCPEEVQAMSGPDLIHPDDMPGLWNRFYECVLVNRSVSTGAYRVKHKDGSWHIYEATYTNLLHEPSVGGVVLNARDVTEDRRTVEALHESEERYRSLFEHNPNAVFAFDLEGRVTSVNSAAVALSGCSREELVGRTLCTLLDDCELASTHFDNALGGQSQSFLSAIRHTDGRRVELAVTLVPIRTDGQQRGVFGIAQDVTAAMRAERAIQASEARIRSAFEHASIGLALADLQGRFVQVNPAFCAITGYSVAELQALDFPSITHPDDRGRNLELVARLLEGGQPGYVLDKRYVRKDGSATWVRTSVSTVRNADGQPTALIALVEDIADRKLAEEQHLELMREQAARKQAEELARAKDELISVVSHELASPATTLVGFADLLASRTLSDDEQQEVLTTMIEEGCRLTALIQDFLDIQRLHHGRLELHPRAIDLHGLLERAAATARSDTDHPFSLDLPSSLPPLEADPARIKQVVANLLSNARKYTPPGRSIRLAARAMDRAVEVSVSDDGLGLPAEALPHVFEQFYRVNRADRVRVKGTGLGLAIVKKLVEAHGGQVGVDSAGPGRGSRFWFRLPVATAACSPSVVLTSSACQHAA